MKEPKVTDLKKYLSAILKMNKKYITSERLSKVVGVYPEIIDNNLSYFEPTLAMDPEFNLMELVPKMKAYINKIEEEKTNTLVKKVAISKKQIEQYESIGDFLYKKMTIGGGLVNKNAELSNSDLKILKRLISEEQNRRKSR